MRRNCRTCNLKQQKELWSISGNLLAKVSWKEGDTFKFSVCVCVCVSSLVCMVGVIFVYVDTVFWVLWVFFFMLNCMFEHDYLDTYCFECLICMHFVLCVFGPVQRNWACFTWKGALEIRSLLLLLLLLLYYFLFQEACQWTWQWWWTRCDDYISGQCCTAGFPCQHRKPHPGSGQRCILQHDFVGVLPYLVVFLVVQCWWLHWQTLNIMK